MIAALVADNTHRQWDSHRQRERGGTAMTLNENVRFIFTMRRFAAGPML